jgi:hypothetical protein
MATAQRTEAGDLARAFAGFLSRHQDSGPIGLTWPRTGPPKRTPEEIERAQRIVVEGLEMAGHHVTPRVLRGAIADAGGADGYATLADYSIALAQFIEARRRPTHTGRRGES